jgi:hypothetical protein
MHFATMLPHLSAASQLIRSDLQVAAADPDYHIKSCILHTHAKDAFLSNLFQLPFMNDRTSHRKDLKGFHFGVDNKYRSYHHFFFFQPFLTLV